MKKSVSMVCHSELTMRHPELHMRHPDESQDLIKKMGTTCMNQS